MVFKGIDFFAIPFQFRFNGGVGYRSETGGFLTALAIFILCSQLSMNLWTYWNNNIPNISSYSQVNNPHLNNKIFQHTDIRIGLYLFNKKIVDENGNILQEEQWKKLTYEQALEYVDVEIVIDTMKKYRKIGTMQKCKNNPNFDFCVPDKLRDMKYSPLTEEFQMNAPMIQIKSCAYRKCKEIPFNLQYVAQYEYGGFLVEKIRDPAFRKSKLFFGHINSDGGRIEEINLVVNTLEDDFGFIDKYLFNLKEQNRSILRIASQNSAFKSPKDESEEFFFQQIKFTILGTSMKIRRDYFTIMDLLGKMGGVFASILGIFRIINIKVNSGGLKLKIAKSLFGTKYIRDYVGFSSYNQYRRMRLTGLFLCCFQRNKRKLAVEKYQACVQMVNKQMDIIVFIRRLMDNSFLSSTLIQQKFGNMIPQLELKQVIQKQVLAKKRKDVKNRTEKKIRKENEKIDDIDKISKKDSNLQMFQDLVQQDCHKQLMLMGMEEFQEEMEHYKRIHPSQAESDKKLYDELLENIENARSQDDKTTSQVYQKMREEVASLFNPEEVEAELEREIRRQELQLW